MSLPKLTAERVRELRERRARGERTTVLAAAFGVSTSMVAQVCTGQIWRSAGGPITRVRMSGDLAARLEQLSDRTGGAASCWLFKGALTPDGYGRLYFDGRELPAHRAALELRLGRQLTAGEVARHGRDCPRRCVNPAHLEPGTPADNARDTVEHGRSLRGSRNPAARLSEMQVREILLSDRAITFEELGRRHGVTGRAIASIVRGERWAHVRAGGAR